MSGAEWEVAYSSPNAVSRVQHQLDVPSRGSLASEDREWECLYDNIDQEAIDKRDRTAEPEAAPSDSSSCHGCDEEEGESEDEDEGGAPPQLWFVLVPLAATTSPGLLCATDANFSCITTPRCIPSSNLATTRALRVLI